MEMKKLPKQCQAGPVRYGRCSVVMRVPGSRLESRICLIEPAGVPVTRNSCQESVLSNLAENVSGAEGDQNCRQRVGLDETDQLVLCVCNLVDLLLYGLACVGDCPFRAFAHAAGPFVALGRCI
jgi:hypothetical protein